MYELGGPHTYSFREILEFILTTIGKERSLMPIPSGIASIIGGMQRIAAASAAHARDQVRLLRSPDNIVSPNVRTFANLGITPTAVETIVPEYLARFRKHVSMAA